MDSKKLEILVTAADLGSFSRASEVVGYTQSGLTHMMDSLEKEIGFPLLERGHGGVFLTANGEKLMPAIREFLRANAALDSLVKQIREEKSSTIHVAAYASIAMHWLPEILYQFRRECSDVNIDLRMVDNALEPFELLEAGKTDIIFASRQNGYMNCCDWIPLYSEPLCAILPPDYPIAGRKTFPIKEFEGQDFLMPYGKFGIDVEAAFEKAGANVVSRPVYVDDETLIRMVEHGLGMTMMAELMFRGRIGSTLCVPVSPPMFRELGMGVRSLKTAPAPIRQMTDCVLQHIAELKNA